jgi:hypothetical protein
VRRVESLRREVRHAAEVVARDLPAERERLGDAEVEHLYIAVLGDPDVSRLQVTMHQRPELPAVDGGVEAMGRVEKDTQLRGDANRVGRRGRSARNDL